MRQENPSASTTASGAAARTAGSRCVLGDRHRHLVVAPLHAQVAGQPAAAAEPGDRRARRRASSARVGRPAQHDGVVAVRLRDDLEPGQVDGGVQPGAPAQQLGEGAGARRDPRGRAGRRAARRRRRAATASAGRLQPDDRDAGVDVRARASRRCAPGSRRAASSWPVVIQVSAAAGVVAGAPAPGSRPPRARATAARPISGAKWSVNESTHSTTGVAGRPADADAAAGPAPERSAARTPGSVAALVDAGGRLGQPRDRAEPQHRVDQRRRRGAARSGPPRQPARARSALRGRSRRR